jgi:DNA-binding NarL/FixJ family response regulator
MVENSRLTARPRKEYAGMSSRLNIFRRMIVYLFEPNPLLRKLINSKLRVCGRGKVINVTQPGPGFESGPEGITSIAILDRGTLGPRFRTELQTATLGLPGGRIAVLDNEMNAADLSGLIRLGVHAFLSYQRLEKELGMVLLRLSSGQLYFPTAVMEHYIKATIDSALPDEGRCAALTPRQHQIMAMLRQGLSNKEISAALHISESTVKFHLAKLFGKLGVSDRRAVLLLPPDRMKSYGFYGAREQLSLVS